MSFEVLEADLRFETETQSGPAIRPKGRDGPGIETAARKLRARGFSYRRIAQELRIRYDQVTHWLSVPDETVGPRDIPPSSTVHASREAAHAARTIVQQPGFVPQPAPAISQASPSAREAALEQRVHDLMATLRQLTKENQERESRLQQIIEQERRFAQERMDRFGEDIADLRETVRAMTDRIGAASADDPAATRRTFWRRRSG